MVEKAIGLDAIFFFILSQLYHQRFFHLSWVGLGH